MKALRLLALALVTATTLVVWAPAASADTPSGAWTDPAPSGKVDNVPLAYLQRAQKLQGHADFPAGSVASVSFTLVQDAANTAPSDPCSASSVVKPQSVPGSGSHVDFAFDAPFPCNRKYEVRATVTPAKRTLQSDTPAFLNLWVAVAIPPATTSGLRAAVLPDDDRGVQLTWDSAAHEADFIGFEVRRATGNGAFDPVADVAPSATTWSDHLMPHGGATLRYQVVGMRPGPEPGTTVFAATGSTVSADVPPVPSTTVAGSGAGGGDSAGPSGSGASGSGVNPSRMPTGQATTSVHREFVVPGSTAHEPTTVDSGFQQRLPFKAKAGDAAASGDGSAVARLPDSKEDDASRPRLLLVGGASVAFSWAMLLRLLSRRAVLY